MPAFQHLPFSPAELSYLHTSLSSHPPLRPDSRLPTDFRPLSAETGILPTTNGSAHLSFSDGSEAIVGVKADVERTPGQDHEQQEGGEDVPMQDSQDSSAKKCKGRSAWVDLSLTLPGLRDDDSNLIFLEEMLREPLVTPTSSPQSESMPSTLQDTLVINSRWHWRLSIDVLLISSSGLASYPLPLLSMAIHLALRDTRLPRLKSEGEEDPSADDDWDASRYLFDRENTTKPPVTLLVVLVGDNVLFDPSREELSVADGVLAVGVASTGSSKEQQAAQVLSIRSIETGAKDTMKGVPREEVEEWAEVKGVWRPKLGGVKRQVVKKVVKEVTTGGVGMDVLRGLDGFLGAEREVEARARAVGG